MTQVLLLVCMCVPVLGQWWDPLYCTLLAAGGCYPPGPTADGFDYMQGVFWLSVPFLVLGGLFLAFGEWGSGEPPSGTS